MSETLKMRVLAALREDVYTSGSLLGGRLGVSRTMIWKTVNQLQLDGYQIEASTRLGYRLVAGSDVLSQAEIGRMLQATGLTDWIRQVTYAETCDSTNLMARRGAGEGAPAAGLYVAAEQRAGRGRRGRTWLSAAGENLTFSLLLRPAADPAALAPVTLFAGLCAAEALNELLRNELGLIEPVGIKWPNDLIITAGGRKLAGLLTEMILEEHTVQALIIGIGINVNTIALPEAIADTATSLRITYGRTFSRVDVLRRILAVLHRRLAQLTDRTWIAEYRRLCLTLDRDVLIRHADGSCSTGRAVDLDAAGELIIAGPDGSLQTVRSGEVSVRGLASDAILSTNSVE
jgi:BirA family biotin operon repressor/biotin-[acetyl-CoA-carboxylase] ligase